MISADMQDATQFEKDLMHVRDRALPFATKATVNRAAFETRREARQIIERDFVNRNKFTVNSVRVDMAKGLDIRSQQSVVGSIADYMERVELGGTEDGAAITTGYAAGQPNARPRTKMARPANSIRRIQLRGNVGRRGVSSPQQMAQTVKRAASKGIKDIYLKGRTFEGLFRLTGSRKNPVLRMTQDLSRKTVPVPKSPWLMPATDRVTPQLDRFYADALRFQLKRLGSFRG